MKAETRVEGPWTDKDYSEPRVKFESIKIMQECGLKSWQADLLRKVSTFDFRKINIVFDPIGNNGKGFLDDWIYFHRLGQWIPSTLNANDIAQFVASFPASKLYIFDMPPSKDKRSLFNLYTAIEMIKDGKVFDTRYKGKVMRMERPRVIVFTNQCPDLKYLTRDRWEVSTIKKGKLVPFGFDKPTLEYGPAQGYGPESPRKQKAEIHGCILKKNVAMMASDGLPPHPPSLHHGLAV